jgi:alpha-glucosidase (family GH31 glycosyl hydrolase)
VKPFIFLNPFLSDTNSTVYQEALSNKFFVKDGSDSVYWVHSDSIEFAMIDFTND